MKSQSLKIPKTSLRANFVYIFRLETILETKGTTNDITVPVLALKATRNLNVLIKYPDIQILPTAGYALTQKFVIFHSFVDLLKNDHKVLNPFSFQVTVSFDNPNYDWIFESSI
jgi:hypothetical protein